MGDVRRRRSTKAGYLSVGPVLSVPLSYNPLHACEVLTACGHIIGEAYNVHEMPCAVAGGVLFKATAAIAKISPYRRNGVIGKYQCASGKI